MQNRLLTTLSQWVLILISVFGALSSEAAIADFAGGYASNLSTVEGDPAAAVYYGRVELTVTTKGTVTGKMLTRSGKSYSFATTVTQAVGSTTANQTNVVVFRNAQKIGLINFTLTINPDGTLIIIGENINPADSMAVFVSESSLKYAIFTGKTGSIPSWAGFYTLALVAPTPSVPTVPAGAGYASLTVSSNGTLTYKGKLGDGTAFTGSAKPSVNGDYSIYLVPSGYAVGGYFSMELNMTSLGLQAASADWKKAPKAADKTYSSGFSAQPTVIVRPWLVAAKGSFPLGNLLGFGTSKNFNVLFSNEGLSDADYSATLPDTARVTLLSGIIAVSGAANAPAENNITAWNALWSVKLNALTGVYTGTQVLRHTVGTKVIIRKIPVEGVFTMPDSITSAPFAYGQYRVTPIAVGAKAVSGLVTFTGPITENPLVATAGTYTARMDETLLEDGKLVNGEYVPAAKPARPAGSPADNQVVKVIISEDLSKIIFNGVELTYIGPALYGRVYQKTYVPRSVGALGGQFAVTIGVHPVTGQITSLAGLTEFITASLSPRSQTTIFEVKAPFALNFTKL